MCCSTDLLLDCLDLKFWTYIARALNFWAASLPPHSNFWNADLQLSGSIKKEQERRGKEKAGRENGGRLRQGNWFSALLTNSELKPEKVKCGLNTLNSLDLGGLPKCLTHCKPQFTMVYQLVNRNEQDNKNSSMLLCLSKWAYNTWTSSWLQICDP